MRNICLALFATVFGIAFAQPQAVKHASVIEALRKAEPAVSKVIGLPPAPLSKAKDGVASRREIVAMFDQLFKHYQPKFRVSPRPYAVDSVAIEERNSDPRTRATLKKLVEWGFVSPVGPLVTNSTDTMTAAEFGDALGFFFTQALYVAHQPDPRWTPDLGGGG
ncbi:hypothetical protein QPK87_04920 [Kamptonema cortianum]|nr:hypothetical protein [Geitlerinema splendidum]MDK3155919.1 hypothetical protein [Kamptonema cortianum]